VSNACGHCCFCVLCGFVWHGVQLRFQPKKDKQGILRLHSLGHDGYWLSDMRDSQLEELLHGIPYGVVFENDNAVRQLLVPSYPLLRPRVRSLPFSTHTVRNLCESWLMCVQTRIFMFPVHASGEFLRISSLSSALYVTMGLAQPIRPQIMLFLPLACVRYLFVVYMMTRNYIRAVRVLATFSTDVSLTEEQAYLARCAGKTSTDSHPDAHACRLRLFSLCREADPDFTVPWDVLEDYSQYLKKMSAVSVECRLSGAEEDVLLAFYESKEEHKKCPGAMDIQTRRNYKTAVGMCVASSCSEQWFTFPGVRVGVGGSVVAWLPVSSAYMLASYKASPWNVRCVCRLCLAADVLRSHAHRHAFPLLFWHRFARGMHGPMDVWCQGSRQCMRWKACGMTPFLGGVTERGSSCSTTC